jgi:hypothetical protein
MLDPRTMLNATDLDDRHTTGNAYKVWHLSSSLNIHTMNSYLLADGSAFSQVPQEYQVHTVSHTSSAFTSQLSHSLQVDYTSSSSEESSPVYPLGYYDNSARSSVTSFDEDIFNSQLANHDDLSLQYPDPWPSQTPSYDPPSLAPLHISAPDPIYPADIPLHAPVPRLPSDPYNDSQHPAKQLTPLPRNKVTERASKQNFPQQPSLLDEYPQLMFPTPSELLHDLTVHDDAVAQAREDTDSETKVESQRKARQRALAESIGFTPTDPYVCLSKTVYYR